MRSARLLNQVNEIRKTDLHPSFFFKNLNALKYHFYMHKAAVCSIAFRSTNLLCLLQLFAVNF